MSLVKIIIHLLGYLIFTVVKDEELLVSVLDKGLLRDELWELSLKCQ